MTETPSTGGPVAGAQQSAASGEHRPAGALDTGGTATRSTQDMFGATRGGDTSGFGGLVPRAASYASTPRPYGGWFDEAVDVLQESLPGFADAIQRVVVDRGELTLYVKADRIRDI